MVSLGVTLGKCVYRDIVDNEGREFNYPAKGNDYEIGF